MRRSPTATVRRAAANVAAWHASSVRALGVVPHRSSRWWTCRLSDPSIWFTAISLRPASRAGDREADAVLSSPAWAANVCDSYSSLDLTPSGLVAHHTAPWFVRAPAATPPADPCAGPVGLRIDAVRTPAALAVYERTVAAAFSGPPCHQPFLVHAPPILADPAMSVWLAHLDGEPVGTAMAYDSAGVRGIYGVGTVPGARNAGIATALTRTVLDDRPGCIATLQPSAQAEGLYRDLGFTDAGRWTFWTAPIT